MNEIIVNARAKINLGLDVIRRREDGYHDLRMIMQTLKLHDVLNIKKTEGKETTLSINTDCLSAGPDNLVCKAASLFLQEEGIESGLEISLIKNIPMAAGLAGGSADAAAVLRGLNELFDCGLSDRELRKMGVKIGADVPYCLMGGTALAEGIGEILTPLKEAPGLFAVLAKPSADISTGYVYGHLNIPALKSHPDIDGQIEAIRNGDIRKLTDKMENVLETVTIPACPVIADIKKRMIELGAAGSMMSGSGPTVFGLFETEEAAGNCAERLKKEMPDLTVILTAFD